MVLVQTEIHLKVPPRRVWETLTDFESYHLWNPYILVQQSGKRIGEVGWTLRQHRGRRVVTAPATLTISEDSTELSWTWAVWSVFKFGEQYILRSRSGGTSVTHIAKCEGPLSKLFARRLSARLAVVLTAADEGLRDYLAGKQDDLAEAGRGFRSRQRRQGSLRRKR